MKLVCFEVVKKFGIYNQGENNCEHFTGGEVEEKLHHELGQKVLTIQILPTSERPAIVCHVSAYTYHPCLINKEIVML